MCLPRAQPVHVLDLDSAQFPQADWFGSYPIMIQISFLLTNHLRVLPQQRIQHILAFWHLPQFKHFVEDVDLGLDSDRIPAEESDYDQL